MKKKKIVVIIPTYNEKENISKIIPAITKVFNEDSINGKIMVVDDNSPDETGKIAEKLSKKYPVVVIHRKFNRGYGNSIIEGFKRAITIRADIVITMDADMSHDPKVLPAMINALEVADVSIGSRRIPGGKIIGWNLWRHFCSAGATIFSKLMLGIKTKDITTGYRGYKIGVLEKIPFQKIKSNGYSFLEELLYIVEKNKFKIKEIPIIFLDRKFGKSKLSKKEIVNFFKTILRLKFQNEK
jgi:dolichol-phosphate mannosyltransferase